MTLSWRLKLAISVVVAPLTYMMVDRTPPYIRTAGEILPTDPAECHMAPDSTIGRLVANSCVVVKWDIETMWGPFTCEPATSKHVSRAIEDVNGRHELPKTENVYGGDRKPWSNPLVRPWILPAYSVPGEAVYSSTACFRCNPLQKMGMREPVCVSEPVIPYNVEASATR